jgi:hypothetical protein
MIDAATVEATWRRIGAFTEAQARGEAERGGIEQPDLLAFVVAFTQELSPAAHELGIYLFHVVLAIFRAAAGQRVPRVKAGAIERQWTENSEALERLGRTHARFLERAALQQVSGEPEVMRYLVEAVMDAGDDPEDPVELTEEDQGMLFLVLKTVVDVLQQAGGRGRRLTNSA